MCLPRDMTNTLLRGWDRCEQICVERSNSALGQGLDRSLVVSPAGQCMHTYAPTSKLTHAPWRTQRGCGLCSLEAPCHLLSPRHQLSWLSRIWDKLCWLYKLSAELLGRPRRSSEAVVVSQAAAKQG